MYQTRNIWRIERKNKNGQVETEIHEQGYEYVQMFENLVSLLTNKNVAETR